MIKRNVALFLMSCFPLLLSAANNPIDVIQAQRFDRTACIEKKASECTHIRCTAGPYSDDRDCPEKCQRAARAQCDVSS